MKLAAASLGASICGIQVPASHPGHSSYLVTQQGSWHNYQWKYTSIKDCILRWRISVFCLQPSCVSRGIPPQEPGWVPAPCGLWLPVPCCSWRPPALTWGMRLSPAATGWQQRRKERRGKLGEIQWLGDFSSWSRQTFTWSWELALALRWKLGLCWTFYALQIFFLHSLKPFWMFIG